MKQAPDNPKKRLFFALWPDAETLTQITQASQCLNQQQGRRVTTENLHLTLAFIGHVDAERQACLEAVAEKVRPSSFELELTEFGYFKKPQIIWLGPKHCPDPLQNLVDELNEGFVECGYRPEHSCYRPHVSLLRKASPLGEAMQAQVVRWKVDRFYLAESSSTDAGVVYQKIKTYLFNQ